MPQQVFQKKLISYWGTEREMRNVNQSGLAPQCCGVTLLANQTQEKQSKRVCGRIVCYYCWRWSCIITNTNKNHIFLIKHNQAGGWRTNKSKLSVQENCEPTWDIKSSYQENFTEEETGDAVNSRNFLCGYHLW